MKHLAPAAFAVSAFLIILPACSGGASSNQQSKDIVPLTTSQRIGERTTIVLPKSLDPAQRQFPVTRGTLVYAIPTYKIVYENAAGGAIAYAYGRISVTRTANATLITSTGSKKVQTFPSNATITQMRPSFLFLRPDMQKPPVAENLAPIAVAR